MTTRGLVGAIFLATLLVGLCALRLLLQRELDGTLTLATPAAEFAQYRLVPMIAAVIAGSALGISGLSLQVLLRNPLASPWILGLSSGAGLGVMAVLYASHVRGEAIAVGETAGALVGAVGALSVVYVLSRRRGGIDPISMVLVGVVVSVMCGAGIMLLQHLVPTGLRGEFATWMMGQLPESVPTWQLGACGAVALGGCFLAMLWGPSMDAACLSEDEARSVGLDVAQLRRRLFLLSSVLAAIAVILAGPIAFVGLIAPHAASLVCGVHHRGRAVATAMLGAILLVAADDLRQGLDLGGGRMPVGILTSLAGGVVFLGLLLGKGRRS